MGEYDKKLQLGKILQGLKYKAGGQKHATPAPCDGCLNMFITCIWMYKLRTCGTEAYTTNNLTAL